MKKGFTLVEMLGVIVIIGFLVIMVIPAVTNIIRNSREDLYELQIKNIESAAKNWAAENPFKMPREDGDSITLFLHNLHEGGFIETGITNPITGEEFPRDMIIVITKNINTYEYSVSNEITSINFIEGSPSIYLNGALEDTVLLGSEFAGVSNDDITVTVNNTEISNDYKSFTVTKDSIVVANVDPLIAGTYYIEYTVSYGSFNATLNRLIIVQ